MGRNRAVAARSSIVGILVGLVVATLIVLALGQWTRATAVPDDKLRGLVEQRKQLDAAAKETGGLSGRHKALYSKLEHDIAVARAAGDTDRRKQHGVSFGVPMAVAVLATGAALLAGSGAVALALVTGGLALAWYVPVAAAVDRSNGWLIAGVVLAACLSALVWWRGRSVRA